jgi:hypothetical protein
VEGERDTKSRASVREVPMPAVLRGILDKHTARLALEGDALMFPQLETPTRPFTPGYVQDRADEAWAATCATCGATKDDHDAHRCEAFEPLARATLHELRHG